MFSGDRIGAFEEGGQGGLPAASWPRRSLEHPVERLAHQLRLGDPERPGLLLQRPLLPLVDVELFAHHDVYITYISYFVNPAVPRISR